MNSNKLPSYDTVRNCLVGQETGVTVVHTPTQFMQAMSLRSTVYIGEQSCPYFEEFDGNDFSATHLIAYDRGEPVATIRIRYYADMAKPERLVIHPDYRRSRIAFAIVKATKEFCLKKGYTRIYGHAQQGKEDFWKLFGGKPIPAHDQFVFSDHLYTEMVCNYEPIKTSLTIGTNPHVLIRPEGRWDIPGPLERSIDRGAKSTHRRIHARSNNK